MDYKGILISSMAGGGGDFIKNVIRICHKDAPTEGTLRAIRLDAEYFPADYDNMFFREHVVCFKDPPGSLQDQLQSIVWKHFTYHTEEPDLNSDLSPYFDGGRYSSAQFHGLFNKLQVIQGEFYEEDYYEGKKSLEIIDFPDGLSLYQLNGLSKIGYLKKIINDYNLKLYAIDFSNPKWYTYVQFVDVFTHIFSNDHGFSQKPAFRLKHLLKNYEKLVSGEHYKEADYTSQEFPKVIEAAKNFGIDMETIDLYTLHETRDFNGLVDQLAKSYPLDKYLNERNTDIVNRAWDERIDKMKQMGLWT